MGSRFEPVLDLFDNQLVIVMSLMSKKMMPATFLPLFRLTPASFEATTPPLRRQPTDHNFGSLLMLAMRVSHSCSLPGLPQRECCFPAGIYDPVKAAVEAFGRAQEAATPDKQAALRAWMRGIICSEGARHQDLGEGDVVLLPRRESLLSVVEDSKSVEPPSA